MRVVAEQDTDLELQHGGFDAAVFAQHALVDPHSLAAVIDHTLLTADATREQIIALAHQAGEHRLACAMVNPAWAPLASSVLDGSGVHVGVVIGFPLGVNLTTSKRDEAREMVKLGVRELDMVLNLGMLRSGMNAQVERDIHAVVEVAQDAGALVKVILETGLLTVEEKLRGSELAILAGADYLATGTDFSPHATTAADVALLRGIAGSRCGVKAAGGIHTLADARAMLDAGANRLGTRESVTILQTLQT